MLLLIFCIEKLFVKYANVNYTLKYIENFNDFGNTFLKNVIRLIFFVMLFYILNIF